MFTTLAYVVELLRQFLIVWITCVLTMPLRLYLPSLIYRFIHWNRQVNDKTSDFKISGIFVLFTSITGIFSAFFYWLIGFIDTFSCLLLLILFLFKGEGHGGTFSWIFLLLIYLFYYFLAKRCINTWIHEN